MRSLITRVIAPALLSFSSAAAQTIERDIAYGSDIAQRLDLTLPRGTGFPTVIFVHGGSLTSGDKADSDYGDVCRPFAAEGIGCANVNYRLAPAHRWPAMAEDVARAVAWAHANIESRGGDRRKLILMGHSSGAMLVALLGSDARFLAGQNLQLSSIIGVVPMGSIMWDDDLQQAITRNGRARVEERFKATPDFGMYDGLDQYLDMWPITHVRAGMPRFLFLIAEQEQEQPPVLRTNREFVERARAQGNRADYLVLQDRTHSSAVRRLDEPGDAGFLAIRDFVRAIISE
jgi:acetyl esterase/lipase